MIRQHGVEYAQSHFQRKLDAKTITLDRTQNWIAHTVTQLQQQKDPLLDIGDVAALYRGVVRVSIVDLVIRWPANGGRVDANVGGSPAGSGGSGQRVGDGGMARDDVRGGSKGPVRRKEGEEDLPETMMLDRLRVKALSVHFHSDVIAAIILTQVGQVCEPFLRSSSWQSYSDPATTTGAVQRSA